MVNFLNEDVMPRFNTLEEQLRFWYDQNVNKGDDPVLANTSGMMNPVYGAKAFSQVSQESRAWGVLPKFPYNSRGMRALTTNETTSAGTTENGTNPDSDKPDLVEVSVPLKNVRTAYDYSLTAQVVEGKDDTIRLSDLESYYTMRHVSVINSQLLSTNGTVAGNNYESLDRICGSYGEISTVTQADNNAYSTNDLDIYSRDRDAAASWTDAYVDYATTDRAFDASMVLDAMNYVENYDGHTTVVLTGYDTYSDIEDAFEGYVRYNAPTGSLSSTFVNFTVEGVKGVEGTGKGTRTAQIYGVPLFKSKDVVQETSGKSRIYGLDTSVDPLGQGPRLGIKLGMPTMRFESRDVIANDNLAYRYLLVTIAELQCNHFRSQFKIRDLA